MYEIVVIGAGFSGVLTALKLAKKYKVKLIEAGPEIIPTTSSSYNECYKLHTGLHYVGDKATAELCLRNSVEFAREMADFIAGGNDLEKPWRRGRHYLMSNSMVNADQMSHIAFHLQKVYRELVHRDPKNKVFGEPEHFIKFLKSSDFPYISEEIPYFEDREEKGKVKVILGIESGESQIDIDALKQHLTAQIKSNKNIEFVPNVEVRSIHFNEKDFTYNLLLSTWEQEKTRIVVNCAWQNIEKINKTAGIRTSNDVNRIKASILVKLPPELQQMNTCIFSSGPYCSITVMPNGTAILTSERATNVGFYQANEHIPSKTEELLSKLTLEHSHGCYVAKTIRKDSASYLKEPFKTALENAEILELRVGFVKIADKNKKYDNSAIYDPQSSIHSRNHLGIKVEGLGFFSNAAMKMTFIVGNATLISLAVDKHMEEIKRIFSAIVANHVLNTQRISSPSDLGWYKQSLSSLVNVASNVALNVASQDPRLLFNFFGHQNNKLALPQREESLSPDDTCIINSNGATGYG